MESDRRTLTILPIALRRVHVWSTFYRARCIDPLRGRQVRPRGGRRRRIRRGARTGPSFSRLARTTLLAPYRRSNKRENPKSENARSLFQQTQKSPSSGVWRGWNRRKRKKRVTHSTHGRCTRVASHASPFAQELLEHLVCCASEDATELCGRWCRTCGRCEEGGIVTD
jgi:hypothetical protein